LSIKHSEKGIKQEKWDLYVIIFGTNGMAVNVKGAALQEMKDTNGMVANVRGAVRHEMNIIIGKEVNASFAVKREMKDMKHLTPPQSLH